jgi:hypothetical protein
MDPPNVLWFAGTYATAIASYGLLGALPTSHRSLWIFLVALAFLAVYAAAARLLRLGRWWIPGGLAASLAVGMTPAVAVAFLRLIGVWSSDFPLTDFNGWAVGVAVLTALAGLAAYTLTRFPFILSIVAGAVIVSGQFLAVVGNRATGDERATAALLTGALLVIVGVLLDAFARRRDAFWFHTLGWFSAGAGLAWFALAPSGDPNRGFVPMLILGVLLVIAAGPIRRATWAVYGVLGYYAALLHYLQDALNETRWPFALTLLALALGIFVLGMLQQRYGTRWNERFVRRPPPSIGSTP